MRLIPPHHLDILKSPSQRTITPFSWVTANNHHPGKALSFGLYHDLPCMSALSTHLRAFVHSPIIPDFGGTTALIGWVGGRWSRHVFLGGLSCAPAGRLASWRPGPTSGAPGTMS